MLLRLHAFWKGSSYLNKDSACKRSLLALSSTVTLLHFTAHKLFTMDGEGSSAQADEAFLEGPQASALLARVSNIFEEKMQGLKRSIMTEHQTLSHKIEKKMKKSDMTFKSKTNKIQYEINAELMDSMVQAKDKLVEYPPAVSKAVELLTEGIDVVSERNRDIEMCEQSPYGWLTVEEYKLRAVSNDSDDDRRIRRAEAAVEKRLDSKKKPKKGKSIPTRGGYNQPNNSYYPPPPPPVYFQPFRGGRGRGAYPRRNTTNDFCFACHTKGHWRDECPYTDPNTGQLYEQYQYAQPTGGQR